jgi:hypothetical protein
MGVLFPGDKVIKSEKPLESMAVNIENDAKTIRNVRKYAEFFVDLSA